MLRSDEQVRRIILHFQNYEMMQNIAIIFYLAILTHVSFYEIGKIHYWIGLDEPVLLSIHSIWFETYDSCCGRPMAGLGAALGNALAPAKTVSLLIGNAIFRFVMAFAILQILRWARLGSALAVGAAVLMVVNPTESLRFSPGLTLPYFSATALLAVAGALFVQSYSRNNICVLILACLVLGIAFLHYETLYPISIIFPVVILLEDKSRRAVLWCCVWYFTTVIFALRFLMFMRTPGAYQNAYLSGFDLVGYANTLWMLTAPIQRFWMSFSELANLVELKFIILVGLVTVAAHVLIREAAWPSRKRLVAICLVAAVALILGVFPGILVTSSQAIVPDLRDDVTMRFEVIPGPAQAVLLGKRCSAPTLSVFA